MTQLSIEQELEILRNKAERVITSLSESLSEKEVLIANLKVDLQDTMQLVKQYEERLSEMEKEIVTLRTDNELLAQTGLVKGVEKVEETKKTEEVRKPKKRKEIF